MTTHILHKTATQASASVLCGAKKHDAVYYDAYLKHDAVYYDAYLMGGEKPAYSTPPTCDTCVLLAFAEPDTVQVCVCSVVGPNCTCAWCKALET